MKKILISLFSILISAHSFSADAHRYQVELIVFDNSKDAKLQSEHWPSHPPMPAIEDTIALNDYQSDIDHQLLQLLPSKYFKLSPSHWALSKKAHKPVFLHIAWQLELSKPYKTQRFHVYAPFDPSYNSAHQLPTYDRYTNWAIDGVISISRSNYINFNADLIFHPPQQLTDLSGKHIEAIALHQKRRLRTQELHYIDHPLYGILVEVTAVED